MNKNFEENIKNITNIYNHQEHLINYYKKRIEELEDEKFKDKYIEKLIKQNKELLEENKRNFIITKEENCQIEEWKNKHIREKHWDTKKDCCENFGAIGGNFTYTFIPTSIGIFGTIKCTCGECFNFRDAF